MFFIITKRLWKIFTQTVYIFVQKPWTTASERKSAADIFLCWRPKKIPNRICHNNAGTEIRAKAIIFYNFYRYFDTRHPTNYIVVKPSKMLWKIFSTFCAKTVKIVQLLLNIFCIETVKENVQLIFFMLRQMCGCFWKHFNVF